MEIKDMKTISLFVICALMFGCVAVEKNVDVKKKESIKSANENIVSSKNNVLTWQDISGISNSNFYNVTLQYLYKNNNVNYTNTLRVVPSPDGKEGTITIPLNKKYDNFYTRVCVVVGNPWPYETITVYCDDKEIKKIKKIGPKTAPLNLNINTKDVGALTIKVKPGRKGYYEKIIFFDTTLK